MHDEQVTIKIVTFPAVYTKIMTSRDIYHHLTRCWTTDISQQYGAYISRRERWVVGSPSRSLPEYCAPVSPFLRHSSTHAWGLDEATENGVVLQWWLLDANCLCTLSCIDLDGRWKPGRSISAESGNTWKFRMEEISGTRLADIRELLISLLHLSDASEGEMRSYRYLWYQVEAYLARCSVNSICQ